MQIACLAPAFMNIYAAFSNCNVARNTKSNDVPELYIRLDIIFSWMNSAYPSSVSITK